MKYYHDLNDVSLTLINFKKIFAVAQKDFLNDCDRYGIEDPISFKNKDAKRLFMHWVILATCEEVIAYKTKNKKIIIYRSLKEDDTFEIQRYMDLDELNTQLLKIINTIKTLLPIQIAICQQASFEGLKHKLDANDGDTVELVYRIFGQMQPTNMSFEKIKKFVKKNKLTFLSKSYFDLLRTKQLWL